MIRYIFFLLGILSGCTDLEETKSTPENTLDLSKNITYLALGDSYTIGQGVPIMSAFPALLKEELEKEGYSFKSFPEIVAQTGWTCDNLSKSLEAKKLTPGSFRLVTLLIGVNDQYQSYGINLYPPAFNRLIQQAIELCGSKDRIVILSIPDYSVTPFGKNRNPDKIKREIEAYNSLNKSIADSLGIKYVNVTDISLKAKDDLSYLASDKLHPSEKMYQEWVIAMLPAVKEALKK